MRICYQASTTSYFHVLSFTKHYFTQMLLAINWCYWQVEKIHACIWRFKVASCKLTSFEIHQIFAKKIRSETFLTNLILYVTNRMIKIWKYICCKELISSSLYKCTLESSFLMLYIFVILGEDNKWWKWPLYCRTYRRTRAWEPHGHLTWWSHSYVSWYTVNSSPCHP